MRHYIQLYQQNIFWFFEKKLPLYCCELERQGLREKIADFLKLFSDKMRGIEAPNIRKSLRVYLCGKGDRQEGSAQRQGRRKDGNLYRLGG
jgi:hypothetical protein